jgi:catalase (peroxidase I)
MLPPDRRREIERFNDRCTSYRHLRELDRARSRPSLADLQRPCQPPYPADFGDYGDLMLCPA